MSRPRGDASQAFPERLTEIAPAADLLRELLDGLPAMVGYWDRDLRNRLANAAYREWFGVGPDDLRGMHIRELLGPELYESNVPELQAALRGERQTFDRTLTDVSGSTRHVQVSYIPDGAGDDVQGFYVLVTEVTARVEAHREAAGAIERHRSIIRSIPNGFVLLFDHELRYVIADGEALPAFGYTAASLEGRTVAEALPPALAAELEPRYLRALAGGSTTWDRVVRRRVFSLTAGPVRDDAGAVVGGVVVATDVTDERRGATIGRAIEEIAKVAADRSALDEVLRRVTSIIHEIFGLDDVVLVRFLDDRTGQALATSPPQDDVGQTFPIGERGTAIGRVVATGRSALQHYDAAGDGIARQLHDRGFRVGGAAPIRVRGELWGALVLASRDASAMDEALLDRLESVSELVGLAIGSADAWEALQHEATTDPVTGLANHRVFHERLAQGLSAARREGRGCGLVLLDLDHFKQVNDTHGHPVGDAVLREVGRRLAAVARGHELAARVGGEEFALVLVGADEHAAVVAAERARRAIADTPFAQVGRLTVSAGAAARGTMAGSDADALLDAADRALYAAKERGRNQVVAASGEPGGSVRRPRR